MMDHEEVEYDLSPVTQLRLRYSGRIPVAIEFFQENSHTNSLTSSLSTESTPLAPKLVFTETDAPHKENEVEQCLHNSKNTISDLNEAYRECTNENQENIEDYIVFISYSKHDKKYVESFLWMLKSYQRNWPKAVSVFRDEQLSKGSTEGWNSEIKRNLEAARIVIFFASYNLFSTDYIHDVEKDIVERKLKNNTIDKFYWIYVRVCNFHQWSELIEKHNSMHGKVDKSRPLNNLDKPKQEAILYECCEELDKFIVKIGLNQQ